MNDRHREVRIWFDRIVASWPRRGESQAPLSPASEQQVFGFSIPDSTRFGGGSGRGGNSGRRRRQTIGGAHETSV